MLNRPYFTGIAGSVQNSHLLGIQDLFARAGANTGNFIFVTALRKTLGKLDRVYFHQADLPFENDNYDYIAISAANWINPQVDLEQITTFIESTDLPCLVAGLGAQISLENEIPNLKKGTMRFLEVVSERSKSISVRGSTTQQVLEHYGITNTSITGCPSLLLYKEKNLNNLDDPKHNGLKNKRIVLQGTRHDTNTNIFEKDHIKNVNLQLYKYAYENKQHLLLQSELPDLYHAMTRFSNPQIIEESTSFLERVYGDDIGKISLYLRQYGLIFWDVENWLAELSKFDFLIGTRIHGCVSALLAGVPTILLTHDMRTKELAEKLSIKHIDIRKINKIDDSFVQTLVEEPFDWSGFNQKMKIYKTQFENFFQENNVFYTM